MFPIEHFLVAFLPVLMYVLVIDRRLPTVRLVAVAFIGSQFPDLVDKPLAYQFGLIPSGRVFMHSLPIALPFLSENASAYLRLQAEVERTLAPFVDGFMSVVRGKIDATEAVRSCPRTTRGGEPAVVRTAMTREFPRCVAGSL